MTLAGLSAFLTQVDSAWEAEATCLAPALIALFFTRLRSTWEVEVN